MPASRKMPKNNCKGTTLKAAPRKESGQKRKVSNCCRFPLVINRYRSRPPLVRKRPPYPLHEGQVPVEMDVPLEVLEQTLLAPVGDIVMGNINAFVVCPVIIPPDFIQHWYCSISNSKIYPGDTVYGKHANEGWIRTVSIQAIPSGRM